MRMIIEHTLLIPLLKELATLSPVQQEVFLFCLEHLPEPKAYTGDLLRIRSAVGCKPRTAQVALQIITKSKILSQMVKYHRINRKEARIHEFQQTQNCLSPDGGDLL